MLRYKIDIADALDRKGFNLYKAKTTKLLSQDTLKKIQREDTNISLESLNRICLILDMQPKDLIEFKATEEEEETKKKYKTNKKARFKMAIKNISINNYFKC